MLAPESGVFIQFPTEAATKRVLHPAKIVSHQQGVFTAELDEPNLRPEAGTDLVVFFDRSGKFMQQSIRVEAVMEGEVKPTFAFRTLGEPASAESRQSFRVSTVFAGVMAKVAQEECAVLDTSATGLSIASKQAYNLGAVMPVTVEFEGRTATGTACVQCADDLGAGRTRYGLHVTDPRTAPGLKRALQEITMSVQRRQLRRLSAAS